MTLYQEMPKDSILSELRKRYTPEQLDFVQLEITQTLYGCHNLGEVQGKLSAIIHRKLNLEEFRRVYQDNFIGI